MKKIILIAGSLIGLTATVFSQTPTYAWAKSSVTQANSSMVDNIGDVAIDTINQYVYATGSFGNPIDFGTGVLNSIDPKTVYLVKYNLNGGIIWAKSFLSNHNNSTSGIAVDNAGNVFITGYSQSDSVIFGSQFLINSHPSSTDYTTGYVVKFDSNGNVLWLKGSVGGGGVIPNDIAIDASGNAYIAGLVVHENGTMAGNSLITPGLFVMKFDGSGNSLWFNQTNISPAINTIGNALAVDKSGNCIVVGTFVADANFGSSTIIYTGSSGTYDRFVAKLNGTTGAFTWAIAGSSWSGPDYNNDVSVDLQNNIYVTGWQTGNGVQEQIVEKYNSSGVSQWTNYYPMTGYNPLSSITTDKQGNSYLGFNMNDTTTYGSYTINTTAPYPFATDLIAIIKIDNTGTVLYAKAMQDPSSNALAQVTNLALDANNNLYICGVVSQTCGFDATTISAGNNTEFLLAKLGSNLSSGINDFNATKNDVFIYPNPSRNQLFVNSNQIESITLIDVNGKIVLQKQLNSSESIDITAISAGLYVAKLNFKNGNNTLQKFIKEN